MRIRKPGVVWIVIVCLLAVAGCKQADDSTGGQPVTEKPEVTKPVEEENQENPEVTKPVEELRTIEKSSFVDIFWTRETEVDTESLRFSSKGYYSYSCSCGNPVNDSDLCESYDYNPETRTITLKCFAVTDTMVTEIIVVKCDGETLVLDFDGDIRTFVKEKEEVIY